MCVCMCGSMQFSSTYRFCITITISHKSSFSCFLCTGIYPYHTPTLFPGNHHVLIISIVLLFQACCINWIIQYVYPLEVHPSYCMNQEVHSFVLMSGSSMYQVSSRNLFFGWDLWFANMFSQSWAYFHSLNRISCGTNVLVWIASTHTFLYALCFSIISKSFSPSPRSGRFYCFQKLL